jgi:hypothetical protein
MAAERSSALEAQEKVLSVSLDALEATAIDPVRDTRRASAGVHGLDSQPLPDEGAQTSGRAMDGVAFGHGSA